MDQRQIDYSAGFGVLFILASAIGGAALGYALLPQFQGGYYATYSDALVTVLIYCSIGIVAGLTFGITVVHLAIRRLTQNHPVEPADTTQSPERDEPHKEGIISAESMTGPKKDGS